MPDENSAAADSPPGPSEGNANNGDVPPRGGRRLAVPLPAKLEMRGDMSSNWRRFERMWRNYEIVTRLREETAEFRTATLLTCIGSEALDVYEGLPFDDDANERQNVEVVLQKFQEFCLGEVNETYESYMFFCRNQDAGETVESYITTLRKMVKTCNFGRLEDRLLRDRVVMGILDENLRSKLLEVRQLDLKQCVDCCRAFESSKHKTKAMTVSQPAHEDLHWVKNRKLTNKTWNQRKPVDNLKKKCMFCGKLHVLDKRHCPAFGKECLKCHRRNHFAEVCKQAKHEAKVHTVDMEKEEYVLVVNQGNTYSRTITATMNIGRETLNFQLDSGATVNVLPESEYIRVTGDSNLQHLDRAESKLLMYNKTEVIPTGQRILTVKNPKNEETYKVRFIVVKSDCKPILGLRAVQHMQLITVNNENIAVVTTSKDDDLMKTYQDVFTGEGRLEGDLHLVTDDTVTPVKLPCRKWPLSVRENVKSELERLTKMEIVTPVDTPTDWISSLVVVAKSNNKIRLCIDPKPLNKALKRNDYAMPTIDDVLPDLQEARYFTHLDAKNGFWHVQLDEDSSFLTTFETPFGKYRWLRMPFGVSPAPEEFQRRIDVALHGLQSVVAVHDDIIVWGKGSTDQEASEDHDNNLRKLLQRCREVNLKLNREKVELKQTKINYLGHIISSDGLRADPKKIDAVKQIPPPVDKAGVQRLLGMVGYLQRFAPNISSTAAPMRELVKKDINFRWDEHVHGKALSEVKKALSEPPVLRYFDEKEQDTTLQCDASEKGLGACLMQKGQPVQYASRALTQTEQNYAQIEKEMLAISFGLDRFEKYVYGRHIVVETDHLPLVTIHKKSLLSSPKRLQRMLLKTQMYDYTVIYKKGVEMYLADTLSRAFHPVAEENNTTTEHIFQTDVEKEIEEINMVDYVSVSAKCLTELQTATKSDKQLCRLMKIIMSGWPDDKNSMREDLKSYYTFREEMSVQDGLIFKGDRIVVPTSMQTEIKERLHSSHVGVQGCLRRASETVYWPNMNADIESYISRCSTCNSIQRTQLALYTGPIWVLSGSQYGAFMATIMGPRWVLQMTLA